MYIIWKDRYLCLLYRVAMNDVAFCKMYVTGKGNLVKFFSVCNLWLMLILSRDFAPCVICRQLINATQRIGK